MYCPWRTGQQREEETVMGRKVGGKNVEDDIQRSVGIQIKVTDKANDLLPNRSGAIFNNSWRLCG